MDSMRCYLIYITFCMKKYIFEAANSLDDNTKSRLKRFIFKSLRALKLGLTMLKPADSHIIQV